VGPHNRHDDTFDAIVLINEHNITMTVMFGIIYTSQKMKNDQCMYAGSGIILHDTVHLRSKMILSTLITVCSLTPHGRRS